MAVIRVERATERSAADRRMSALRTLGFSVALVQQATVVKADVDGEGQPSDETIVWASAPFVLLARK